MACLWRGIMWGTRSGLSQGAWICVWGDEQVSWCVPGPPSFPSRAAGRQNGLTMHVDGTRDDTAAQEDRGKKTAARQNRAHSNASEGSSGLRLLPDQSVCHLLEPQLPIHLTGLRGRQRDRLFNQVNQQNKSNSSGYRAEVHLIKSCLKARIQTEDCNSNWKCWFL